MILRTILIVSAMFFIMFGFADAKTTGTIKTYGGMTYFEVQFVIYDAMQEVHFHDFAGRVIKIRFNDILWINDEYGNDITYLIRPDIIRPGHLLSKPNSGLRLGKSLSDVLIVWLLFGVTKNMPYGDILKDISYDNTTLSSAKSGISGYVGFLFYLKTYLELQINVTFRPLVFQSDWDDLNPQASNYDITFRIHPKSGNRLKSKTDYYFQTGVGLLAHSYGLEDEKLQHFLTFHAGGGFIFQVSERVGFDFNLRVNSVNKFEDPIGSLEGVQLNTSLGLIFRM